MKTILVIEDDLPIRESIVDLLEMNGFKALSAENGREGLAIAQESRPDLILCDIRMPELDGFGVLEGVRETPTIAMTPFIFLSAHSKMTDMRRGMALGADDYLFKPFDPDELLSAISARLNKQAVLLKQLGTRPPLPAPLMPAGEDGLLNHFYQELRNPLSNLNLVIHWLRQCSPDQIDLFMAQDDYSRELSVLQQVNQRRERLSQECARLLDECQIDRLTARELVQLFASS